MYYRDGLFVVDTYKWTMKAPSNSTRNTALK